MRNRSFATDVHLTWDIIVWSVVELCAGDSSWSCIDAGRCGATSGRRSWQPARIYYRYTCPLSLKSA